MSDKKWDSSKQSKIISLDRETKSNFLSETLAGMVTQDKVKQAMRMFFQIIFFMIGVGAAYVSFSIEKDAFNQITRQAMLSLWIVLIFESAKIGTVIVYERGYFAGENNYTDSFKFTVRLFKYLLFILSFICSLAIFSLSLDRPNLEKTKAEDIRQIEDRYAQDKQMLQNRYQAEISGMTNRNGAQFDEEARQIHAYYAPKIENLEKELRKEMENTDSRGNFIGKRYREFMRQLNEVKAERDRKLTDVNRRNQIMLGENERDISHLESAFRQKMADLSQWRSSEIQKITNSSYADDERASNMLMTATLNSLIPDRELTGLIRRFLDVGAVRQIKEKNNYF